MTDEGIIYFIIWCLSTTICFINSKDIAAPIMFVCAALGVYFSEIFFINYRFEIDFFYILVCLFVALLSFVYVGRKSRFVPVNLNGRGHLKFSSSKIDLNIWIVSLPAILGQIYMIQMFDGFAGYLVAAKMGTKYFHGLGPLKSIIATYHPVFLFYFALVINRVNSRKQLLSFFLHFTIFLIMAGLTLSRGTLLAQFVCMGLVYHFSIRKLGPVLVGSALAILLALASIYGVLRETVSFEDGRFALNWGTHCTDCENYSSDAMYRSEWMFAGLFPFQRVIDAPEIEKEYGQTYATAITNFVPRSFWPDKPGPGGVVFTNKYAAGLYDEWSHFTTGLFPEAIINFGIFGGVLFGFFQLSFSILVLSKIHLRYFLNHQLEYDTISSLRNLLIFVYIIYGMGTLIVGEFTSITIGVLIKIFVIFLLSIVLNLTTKNT